MFFLIEIKKDSRPMVMAWGMNGAPIEGSPLLPPAEFVKWADKSPALEPFRDQLPLLLAITRSKGNSFEGRRRTNERVIAQYMKGPGGLPMTEDEIIKAHVPKPKPAKRAVKKAAKKPSTRTTGKGSPE